MAQLEIIDQLAQHAIDFHSHGVGHFDFTEVKALDLEQIESILASRKQRTILTLYLPRQNFSDFLDLMERYDQGKRAGKFNYIQGFSLEGPLLASHGGTPEIGVWMPSPSQWKELAACGKKGLVYVVLSPDAQVLGSPFKFDTSISMAWIAETLLEGGVLPAPGHFIKDDPIQSAQALQTIFDVVAIWGNGPTITDHLFNDMPHNFKHAWRDEDKLNRDKEIAQLNLDSWDLSTLDEKLGPVPAVMMKNARKGLVKICQNFDGEHVDLAVVKKTVQLLGAENMIMMTDSIEGKRLAGRDLHMKANSTLLYQDTGIVAAGSQNVRHQINNMVSIGLTIEEISFITDIVPSGILLNHNDYIKNHINSKDKADCV